MHLREGVLMLTKISKVIKDMRILVPLKNLWWKYNWIYYGRKKEKNLIKEIKRTTPEYYIICYDDPMNVGWTVYERVVLYNCILAEEYGLIPVVDMKNYKNIYKDSDSENTWDLFYIQPGGVSLEKALTSKYIYCDDTLYFFRWIRIRDNKLKDEEYLREKYKKYIVHNNRTQNELSRWWNEIKKREYKKGLALVLRGTDYKTFNHGIQQPMKNVLERALEIYKKHECDYIYLATEDEDMFQLAVENLRGYNLVYADSKRISGDDIGGGYIGNAVRSGRTGYETSMEYLNILYGIQQCSCLVGGVETGATIVSRYARSNPYEYCETLPAIFQ